MLCNGANVAPRLAVAIVPVLILSRRPGFSLTTIWYLAVVAVFVQLGIALLLLKREFPRRLRFERRAAMERIPDSQRRG